MKKDFDKLMNEIKEGLNNFIKPEMEKEEIDKIASLNTLLDNINTEERSSNTTEQYFMPVDNKFDYGVAAGLDRKSVV